MYTEHRRDPEPRHAKSTLRVTPPWRHPQEGHSTQWAFALSSRRESSLANNTRTGAEQGRRTYRLRGRSRQGWRPIPPPPPVPRPERTPETPIPWSGAPSPAFMELIRPPRSPRARSFSLPVFLKGSTEKPNPILAALSQDERKEPDTRQPQQQFELVTEEGIIGDNVRSEQQSFNTAGTRTIHV